MNELMSFVYCLVFTVVFIAGFMALILLFQ